MSFPRPCRYPACPFLTTDTSYCQQRHSHLEPVRQSAHTRGYDHAWRKASKAFLAEHPWCECPTHKGEPDSLHSEVVDHITPHRGDRQLFWDRSNWQALSKRCHDSWKQRVEKAFTQPEPSPTSATRISQVATRITLA